MLVLRTEGFEELVETFITLGEAADALVQAFTLLCLLGLNILLKPLNLLDGLGLVVCEVFVQLLGTWGVEEQHAGLLEPVLLRGAEDFAKGESLQRLCTRKQELSMG